MKNGVSGDDLVQQGDSCYLPVGVHRRMLARIIDDTLYMLIGVSSIFLIISYPIRNRTELISISWVEPLPPPPPRLYIEINAVPYVGPWTLVFFLHLVGALFLVFPALLYELILNATKGQTIGKMVTKIKVINKDTGQPPGWTRSTARWAVLYLPILIPIIGIPIFILTLLSTFFNKNRQGWHDKIAKTIVVSSSTEQILEKNSMASSTGATKRLRLRSRTVDWILHPIVGVTVCIWLMAMLESIGSNFIDIYSEYTSEAIEPTIYRDSEWEAGELLGFDYGSRPFSEYLSSYLRLHILIIGHVIFLLYELPLTALRGQTTGKILTKTRVVCANSGQIPGWKKAGIRWTALYLPLLAAPIIGIPVFFLTAASPLFDRRRRGWHDKLAGTVVVPISEAPDDRPSDSSK